MFSNSLGELFALGAVLGWTISALAFESAGRRIGSVPVNIIRLLMAAVLLALFNGLRGMTPWPNGIAADDFLWLLASGFVGFFLGDLLLFRSYLIIGARMAMLIMSLSPPITALLDLVIFGTRLSLWDGAGILLTMSGVALAVAGRRPAADGGGDGGYPDSASRDDDGNHDATVGETAGGPLSLSRRWLGYLLAFGGAAGQSGGMILGKLGMMGHDALAATFVRTLGGMGGFIPMVLIIGAGGRVLTGMRNRRAMGAMSIGAVAGPVFGVSAILLAMRFSPAAVVSAITAIVPIVIILPSIVFLKDKVRLREVLGAVIAVAGVVVLIVT